ncbi:collagen-like repeat preface domain-containing protein, partial [Bacillus sp. AFS019443]|uniref:collagen-like repeat preface domain-containing protein n=1 Tax=Bacillus sp. AFS019443 TaxID=2034279 RepID=UPI0011455141
MPHFEDHQNNIPEPYFQSGSGRIPTTTSIPISKSQIKIFRTIIANLTEIIPRVFQDPSPSNIEDFINTLITFKKLIRSLDTTSLLKAMGLSIINNLITILESPSFVASAVFIEFQNLINFLLYITKLFRLNTSTFKNIVEQIEELQLIFIQFAPCETKGPTGATGPRGATGATGATGPRGAT